MDQPTPKPDDKPPEELPAARETSWESVLQRAGAADPVATSPAAQAGLPTWARVARIAFPFIVLVGYFIYKSGPLSGWGGPAANEPPRDRDSFTGVEPAREEFERVSRDKVLKALVSRMEGHASRNEWRQVIAAAQSEQDPRAASHPVVQALVAIARTRNGEFNTDLENRIARLQVELGGGGSELDPLRDEIAIARLDQMASRLSSWEILTRNADTITQLAGGTAETPYEVTVRRKLAARFEAVADEMARAAVGILKNDPIQLRQARSAYQQAMRLVVTAEGWRALTPVSPGTTSDVERLSEKLRTTNRALHGPGMPLTDQDPYTWTGRKGDPVHMEPGVAK